MRKILLPFTLVVVSILALAAFAFQSIPQPVATSVIAEKGDHRVGGRVATKLPATLTNEQHRLLNLAYELGKQNGFKNPEIVQAVLLQESHAGGLESFRVANPGPEAYYGPMQIKLAAARDVLKEWPRMFDDYNFHTRTDDEIKANLILNDRFNIEVGTRYLKILKTRYGFSGRELLNAYNRGPGGVKAVNDSFHYAISAEKKLAAVRR
jgi:hypothetical protein